MPTYKQIFMMNFANARGNIRKGVKAEEVWNSIEEFLRLVLTPVKKTRTKAVKSTGQNSKPPSSPSKK